METKIVVTQDLRVGMLIIGKGDAEFLITEIKPGLTPSQCYLWLWKKGAEQPVKRFLAVAGTSFRIGV